MKTINFPSIFNDVLGPVMRGPSSSHCAGALRIGRLARYLMQENIKEVIIDYDPNGSLVTTHSSQGSDMGLYGGFLGLEPDDSQLVNYREELKKSGIKTTVNYVGFNAKHPNTYRLKLINDFEQHEMIAISTGGGIIEVIEIDKATVDIRGDFYEILVFTNDLSCTDKIKQIADNPELFVHQGDKTFIEIKSEKIFLMRKLSSLVHCRGSAL